MICPNCGAEIVKEISELRKFRLKCGVTVAELAKRSWLASATIRKIETGEMKLTENTKAKLKDGYKRLGFDYL